jgi:hypothetical protein
VFSPNAAAVLPQQQALPGFPANTITGLTMSSVSSLSSPSTVMSILVGQAADSTNSILISLTTGCTVDLSNPNPAGSLGQLDTGTVANNKTYYFFLIADSTGANAPGCIASKNPAPTFGTTAPLSHYNLYRAVGIMYTLPTLADITPFTQIDDTFYLTASAPFSQTVGIIAAAIAVGSVPGMTSVDMFGRCAVGVNVMLTSGIGGMASAQAPSSSAFATSPGYAVNATNPNTAFSYSLYTAPDGTTAPGGTIYAQASGPGMLQCYNDGWIWHRGK